MMTPLKSWAVRVRRAWRQRSGNYSQHFNTPIKFAADDWQVNERIVELPYVHANTANASRPLRILELGCTRSHLALTLASFGHDVVGIDLRPYTFNHPRFRFVQGNVLAFDDPFGFDCVIAVSVLEHIGLGAYGEQGDETALRAVAFRLAQLLRPEGRLITTIPFGRSYRDAFLRSFSFAELEALFPDLSLIDAKYFRRAEFKHWTPCSRSDAETVSNAREVRGRTGVNCVGCFTWLKSGPGKGVAALHD